MRGERLEGIADGFLVHDRPIETRTDDSVTRAVALGGRRRTLTLRRSRGYVPASIELPSPRRGRSWPAAGSSRRRSAWRASAAPG